MGSLSQSSSVVKDDGTSVKTVDSKTAKEDGSKVYDHSVTVYDKDGRPTSYETDSKT